MRTQKIFLLSFIVVIAFALMLIISGTGSTPYITTVNYYTGLQGATQSPSNASSIFSLNQNQTQGHNLDSLNSHQITSESDLTLNANFTGIDISSGSYPADPSIAVGPNNIVLITNAGISICNKTGEILSFAGLFDFFSPVRNPSENAGDPKVIFDSKDERFFATATGRFLNPSCSPGTCIAHTLLAVSKTAKPASVSSQDWYFYTFDATLDGNKLTSNWADFPSVGVNDRFLVISSQMISFSTGQNLYPKVRVFEKSKLIRGEPTTWKDYVGMVDPINGSTATSFRAALHFGSSDRFYLVSISFNNACKLVVWVVDDSFLAPLSTSVTSGDCSPPPLAPQPTAGSKPFFTGSNGLQGDLVYRNNSLWMPRVVAHNFGSGPVSAIRWFQIDVSGWPNSVQVIQDSIFGVDGVWQTYPSMMVDESNNVVMVFNRVSKEEFGSLYYTGRRAGDPINTLSSAILLKAGQASLEPEVSDSSSHVSFSDYGGAAFDPINKNFWLFGEYIKNSNAWGTWVGNVSFGRYIAPKRTPITRSILQ